MFDVDNLEWQGGVAVSSLRLLLLQHLLSVPQVSPTSCHINPEESSTVQDVHSKPQPVAICGCIAHGIALLGSSHWPSCKLVSTTLKFSDRDAELHHDSMNHSNHSLRGLPFMDTFLGTVVVH